MTMRNIYFKNLKLILIFIEITSKLRTLRFSLGMNHFTDRFFDSAAFWWYAKIE